MANTPISGYTTATPSDADVSPFVLSPFGAGTNRKFTFAGLTTYLKTALSGYFIGGAPNYISNNWYYPYGSVGITSGLASTAGDINLAPIIIASPVTFKAAALRIATVAAAGNVSIVLYANDPTSNKPIGAPLASVTGLSTATATVVSATFGATVTLQPGIYWLGTQADNATVVFSIQQNTGATGAVSVGSSSAAGVLLTASTTGPQTLVATGTYPTLPTFTGASSFTASSGNRGAAVALQVN